VHFTLAPSVRRRPALRRHCSDDAYPPLLLLLLLPLPTARNQQSAVRQRPQILLSAFQTKLIHSGVF